MTIEEYLNELSTTYSFISELSNKNECRVLKFKNHRQDKNIIVRVFTKNYDIYEELYSVKCENLPLIYDVISLENGQIVLEEFIDGITVAEVMECGNYKYLGARKVIQGVCAALTVLHKLNFVHRDVKPENIIIGKDKRVVLIDFNAARKIKKTNKDTVVMGTIGYASPEQLGVAQSDSRTDIYATGVLLNVMLTGKHPSEKLAKGKAGRIVRKCTNVNPVDRFQTAQKLSSSL